MTVFLVVASLFLIWIQLAEYLGGIEHHYFSVNKQLSKELQVNLDITVLMQCSDISIGVLDESSDRLMVNELVELHGSDMDFSGRKLDSKNVEYETLHGVLKKGRRAGHQRKTIVPNGPACRIFGSIPVNRVRGNLFITGATDMYGRRNPNINNFTHQIDELSFGEYYPKLVNPLDGVNAIIDGHLTAYQYFLSIVPTTYKRTSSGRVVNTNQYSVTERAGETGDSFKIPPGLYFQYDIEPISLTIIESRMPFSQFMIRTINIVGGIIVCTSWLFKLFQAIFSKSFNSTNSYGYLDKSSNEDE